MDLIALFGAASSKGIRTPFVPNSDQPQSIQSQSQQISNSLSSKTPSFPTQAMVIIERGHSSSSSRRSTTRGVAVSPPLKSPNRIDQFNSFNNDENNLNRLEESQSEMGPPMHSMKKLKEKKKKQKRIQNPVAIIEEEEISNHATQFGDEDYLHEHEQQQQQYQNQIDEGYGYKSNSIDEMNQIQQSRGLRNKRFHREGSLERQRKRSHQVNFFFSCYL